MISASRLDLRRTSRGAETLYILDGILFLELFFLYHADGAFNGSGGMLTALFAAAAVLNLAFLLLFESACRKANAARDAETVSRISGISEKLVVLDLWIRIGMLRRSVVTAALAVNLLVGAFLYTNLLS